MYIDEVKIRYKNRNANRPNFHKGSRPRIPSQTIGGAKVQINSESAIQELKNLANKYKNINDPRGFLTDLRNALGMPDSKGASKYGVITIPKEDGTKLVVSLRITNHQANADTYIEHNANYEYNLSIVIKNIVLLYFSRLKVSGVMVNNIQDAVVILNQQLDGVLIMKHESVGYFHSSLTL